MATAIVVVHGVGDPKDGDALSGFVDGLRDAGFRESAARTIDHRVQPDNRAPDQPFVRTYPVHSTCLVDEEKRVDFTVHEVYWGDVSRAKGSVVALVVALFDLIFGLRHIVTAAGQDALRACRGLGGIGTPLTHIVSGSAYVAALIARGPMLALNLLAALVGLTTWALERTMGDTIAQAQAGAIGGSALALIAGYALRAPLARMQWSSATATSLALAGAAALVPALLWRPAVRSEEFDFLNGITSWMSVTAALMALASILMLVAAALALLLSTHRERGGAPEQAPPAAAPRDQLTPRQHLARALTVITFCTTFGIGLFVFAVMLAWTVVRATVEGRLAARIEQGLHLFALVWGSFIAAALAFVAVTLVNGWLNRRRSPKPRLRYIISPAVLVVFLVLSLAYAVLFVPLAISIERPMVVRNLCGNRYTGLCDWHAPFWTHTADFVARWIDWIEDLRPVALAASALLVVLVTSLRAHFLTALDLVLDVLVHFRVVNGQGKTRSYPAWQAVVGRLQDVLDSAVKDSAAGHVVVVAHSQGTTAAMHALGLMTVHDAASDEHRVRSWSKDNVKVDLVTMGCPVSDLYQHYLAGRYEPSLARDGVVHRWINIYRRDDFIGTTVRYGERDWPSNLPVDPRGHTDYWRDRDVVRHIVALLRSGPPPDRPPAPGAAGAATPSP